jgi:DNA-binding HxlR family transcriptional regulator
MLYPESLMLEECEENAGGEAQQEETAIIAAQKERMPAFCPIAATLDLLSEKWTLHIVHALLNGKKRFNEIGHTLGGVNPRTLRDRLRSLEEEGIVERRVLSTIPPWVEYELTDKGRDLQSIMDAMSAWSHRWPGKDAS